MPRTTALLGLTALLALAGTASAENEMRLIDEERDLYRATFEGGTLTDFVEMLQEGLDGRVMFVMPDRGDEIAMPKFDIANVDAAQVIALSRIIAQVPAIEVQDELALPFSQYEGVPVYVFPTSQLLGNVFMTPETDDTIRELRFPGGTVREYVEALKDAGAEGRVVITGHDRDVPMQPVTLRNVTLESAVELLDDLTDEDANRLTRGGTSWNSGLYRVHVSTNARSSTLKRVSRVWSLRHITSQGLDDDTLLAAIEAGSETLNDHAKPTLRYHEPTALLIANGTADALGLIDAIINGLTDSAIADSQFIRGEDRMQQYADMLRRHIERLAVTEATLRNTVEDKARQAAVLQRERAEANQDGNEELASRMAIEIVRLTEQADQADAQAEQLAFRIDGARTRLGQLLELIKRGEEGYAPVPSEANLSRECGVDAFAPTPTP